MQAAALVLLGSSLSSCTRYHATLPPDVVTTPRQITTVPSVARIRGNIPNTSVQLPSRPVSLPSGNNPWKPDAAPREWKYIVLHHTASHAGSVEQIHEQHLGKGWEGIGYHFVIGNGEGMGDGVIETTFRWREQMHGAHAGKAEYNQHGIGIVLIGNFEETSPSSAQLDSVRRLVATLKREYAISAENVIPHSEVKATACPGKNFPLSEVAAVELDYSLSHNLPDEPRPNLAAQYRSPTR
jgi:N-acetyl-anhydromuramyl-L-alanine amidase AmpD